MTIAIVEIDVWQEGPGDFLVAWLPFLAAIGAWPPFPAPTAWRQRGPSTGATLINLCERQVAESRKINANLERTAVALAKRESGDGVPAGAECVRRNLQPFVALQFDNV